MPSFPDFSDSDLFPSFSACPLADGTSLPNADPHHLLGTITENMTLSTSPTFICKDRTGSSFALTLKLPASEIREGVKGGGMDMKPFKKGFGVVVPNARRTGVREGKVGFVEASPLGVHIIPASLELLLALSEREAAREKGLGDGREDCQGCNQEKDVGELARCKGCGWVWYCDKACQMKGWSEEGHNKGCKVYKAVGEAFPQA